MLAPRGNHEGFIRIIELCLQALLVDGEFLRGQPFTAIQTRTI